MDGLVAQGESPGEEGVAALAIALHMVARNGHELERLTARSEQPREERPLGELSNDGILRRAVGTHPSPLRALMLAA